MENTVYKIKIKNTDITIMAFNIRHHTTIQIQPQFTQIQWVKEQKNKNGDAETHAVSSAVNTSLKTLLLSSWFRRSSSPNEGTFITFKTSAFQHNKPQKTFKITISVKQYFLFSSSAGVAKTKQKKTQMREHLAVKRTAPVIQTLKLFNIPTLNI